MHRLGIALLFIASTAAAQQPPREIFPSDYKPSPCAEGLSCKTFTQAGFRDAAFKFLYRDLEESWRVAHDGEMQTLVKPYCAKHATCLTVPGNVAWFCNDIFARELQEACDAKYSPKQQSHDSEQCHAWVDTYSMGVDQEGLADWERAQECSKKLPPRTKPGTLDWWIVPSTIPADYGKDVQVFTIDSETHVPVQATLQFEGQTFYAQNVASGRPTSFYYFKWPRKLVRVPNAEGHTDVIPPMITMSAEGYEPVKTRVPTVVQKVNVTMSPAAGKLRRGANKVTVTVTDAGTGKPVDGQIYLGERTVGLANQPFELTIPAGKRPDLWVRSPYDAYSDVVIAPAR